MLSNMLIRYFMLSVLAERVVSFVLPNQQEILTSSSAEKDPNAILSAQVQTSNLYSQLSY